MKTSKKLIFVLAALIITSSWAANAEVASAEANASEAVICLTPRASSGLTPYVYSVAGSKIIFTSYELPNAPVYVSTSAVSALGIAERAALRQEASEARERGVILKVTYKQLPDGTRQILSFQQSLIGGCEF